MVVHIMNLHDNVGFCKPLICLHGNLMFTYTAWHPRRDNEEVLLWSGPQRAYMYLSLSHVWYILLPSVYLDLACYLSLRLAQHLT